MSSTGELMYSDLLKLKFRSYREGSYIRILIFSVRGSGTVIRMYTRVRKGVHFGLNPRVPLITKEIRVVKCAKDRVIFTNYLQSTLYLLSLVRGSVLSLIDSTVSTSRLN